MGGIASHVRFRPCPCSSVGQSSRLVSGRSSVRFRPRALRNLQLTALPKAKCGPPGSARKPGVQHRGNSVQDRRGHSRPGAGAAGGCRRGVDVLEVGGQRSRQRWYRCPHWSAVTVMRSGAPTLIDCNAPARTLCQPLVVRRLLTGGRRVRVGAVLIVLGLLAVAAWAAWAAWPSQGAHVATGPSAAELARPPYGGGVEVGRNYGYVLFVHCGVRWARVDGVLWKSGAHERGDSPPEGWGNPYHAGTMRLTDNDHAVFQGDPGQVRFERTGLTRPQTPCA